MNKTKKPYKNPMKQIGPGHFRGHAPAKQTPEQQAAQMAQDKKSLALGSEAANTLRRNLKKTVF